MQWMRNKEKEERTELKKNGRNSESDVEKCSFRERKRKRALERLHTHELLPYSAERWQVIKRNLQMTFQFFKWFIKQFILFFQRKIFAPFFMTVTKFVSLVFYIIQKDNHVFSTFLL